MPNVFKSFGVELGQIIENTLCPKYGVTLCDSSIMEEYKFKLHVVELKIKELEMTQGTSNATNDINRLKVQIFYQNEQIAKLK